MECISDIVHAFSTSLAPPTATQRTSQSVSEDGQAEWKRRQMDWMVKTDYADALTTSLAGIKC